MSNPHLFCYRGVKFCRTSLISLQLFNLTFYRGYVILMMLKREGKLLNTRKGNNMDSKYVDMKWYRGGRYTFDEEPEGNYGVYLLLFNDACTIKIGQTSQNFAAREGQIAAVSREGMAAMQWTFSVPQSNEHFFKMKTNAKIKRRFNSIYLETIECILREYAYRRAMNYDGLRVLYVGDRIEGCPEDVIKFVYDWQQEKETIIDPYFSLAATIINVELNREEIIANIENEDYPMILVKDELLRTFYGMAKELDGKKVNLSKMRDEALVTEERKEFAQKA